MNEFTQRSSMLSDIHASANMDANLINRDYKLQMVARFNQARLANPHLKSNEIAHMIGSSDATIKRIRQDINMKSPYRYDISTRKPKKPNEVRQTSEVQPITTNPRAPTTVPKAAPKAPKGNPKKTKKSDIGGRDELIATEYTASNIAEAKRLLAEDTAFD